MDLRIGSLTLNVYVGDAKTTNALLDKLDTLSKGQQTIMINVQALIAAVAAEKSIDQSILALVTGFVAQIADLKTQLTAAIAAGDPAALAAVQQSIDQATADLEANVAQMQKAVTDNTPVAPPPPPPPPPAV